MLEITQQNQEIGVFNACSLLEKEDRDEIISYIEENGFFILLFDEECSFKTHPIIKKVRDKGYIRTYVGLVVVLKGKCETFKEMFDRSSSFVHEKMISTKEFKKIFENDTQVLAFWNDLSKIFGDYHIKGMKKSIFGKKLHYDKIKQFKKKLGKSLEYSDSFLGFEK